MGGQIAKLDWEWASPLDVTPNHCRTLSFVCPLSGWFKHQVREALRQTTLARKPERKDMTGIENGAEYEHTVALFRSEEFSAEDKGLFRDILQGKAVTKDPPSHSLLGVAVARREMITL